MAEPARQWPEAEANAGLRSATSEIVRLQSMIERLEGLNLIQTQRIAADYAEIERLKAEVEQWKQKYRDSSTSCGACADGWGNTEDHTCSLGHNGGHGRAANAEATTNLGRRVLTAEQELRDARDEVGRLRAGACRECGEPIIDPDLLPVFHESCVDPQMERLRAAVTEIHRVARTFSDIAWVGGSSKHWDAAHDALIAVLASHEGHVV